MEGAKVKGGNCQSQEGFLASKYGKSPMELLKKGLENYQKENDTLRELVEPPKKLLK